MKLSTIEGSVVDAIRRAIEEKVPGAEVQVESGSGGHFSITVIAKVFEGQRRLDQQRLVLGAIAHLMSGDGAPVHAVDRLVTKSSV